MMVKFYIYGVNFKKGNVKYLLFSIIFLVYNFSFGDTNKTVEKTYGNVDLLTITGSYVEEINKTLIIAQYTELFSKKYFYNGKIYLCFVEEQFETSSIKAWLSYKKGNDTSDGITVKFYLKEFDIKGCLNIIENTLTQKIKLNKNKKNLEKLYTDKQSNIINELLQTKILRPEIVNELDRLKYFDYYFQNGEYHFFNLNNRDKIILKLENIIDFQILSSELLIVFTKKDEFQIFRTNFEVKTLKIEEYDDFYIPYKVSLIGLNKIIIEFNWRSIFKNKVMLYNLNKDHFYSGHR